MLKLRFDQYIILAYKIYKTVICYFVKCSFYVTLLKGVYHLMCYVLIPSSHQVILYIVECKALKTAAAGLKLLCN